MGAASDFDAASGADEEEREKRGIIAESLCTCGHAAPSHAVDDEERRECSACACEQYEDLSKKRANDADLMRDWLKNPYGGVARQDRIGKPNGPGPAKSIAVGSGQKCGW